MASVRKRVPAHELAPGDWIDDDDLLCRCRVTSVREMSDDPSEIHVRFSVG